MLYVGETQVLTPAGALPIAFEIGAGSLEEAAEKFGQLAKEAIERTVKELQELRRQAASSIVIPQGGMPPMPGAAAAARSRCLDRASEIAARGAASAERSWRSPAPASPPIRESRTSAARRAVDEESARREALQHPLPRRPRGAQGRVEEPHGEPGLDREAQPRASRPGASGKRRKLHALITQNIDELHQQAGNFPTR